MSQIYLWDQDDSFEHQLKLLKEESMAKKSKTSTTRTAATFKLVRDNPGISRSDAIRRLVAKGYNKLTLNTLFSQFLLLDMMRYDDKGGLYTTSATPKGLTHERVKAARAAVKQAAEAVTQQAKPDPRIPNFDRSKPRPEEDDLVNNPKHYTDGGIEVIDFIESKRLGYHLGNVVKYISRAGKKGTNLGMEDLRKARWYLDRAIERNEAHPTTR